MKIPFIGKLLSKVPRKLKDIGAVVYHNSPKICMVAGTGLVIYSVGKAIAVTYKSHDKIAAYGDKAKSIMDYKREVKESADPEEYTDKEFLGDMAALSVEAGKNLASFYWKPLLALGGGLGVIWLGYGTLDKWYAKSLIALDSAVAAFGAYRQNVIDDAGAEADARYLLGVKEVRNTELLTSGEDEGEVTAISTDLVATGDKVNHPYTFYFRRGNEYFDNDYNMNVLRVINWEREFTHNLRIQGRTGHLFMEEVIKKMGGSQENGDIVYPMAGLVGWHMLLGDGYVDFGIFNVDEDGNKHLKPEILAYMKSHDGTIPITLNCDGNIMPLLMKSNKKVEEKE